MAPGGRPTQCNKTKFSLWPTFISPPFYFHSAHILWGGEGIWNPTSLYDWLVVLLALKCTKQHKSNYVLLKICSIMQILFIDSLDLRQSCTVFLKVYKVIQTWLRNSKLETRNSCLSICPRPSHTHTHTHTTYASLTPDCCAIHCQGIDGWESGFVYT